jgi:hypothetical protein
MTERRSTDDITDDHYGLRPGVLWPDQQEAERAGTKEITDRWEREGRFWPLIKAIFWWGE